MKLKNIWPFHNPFGLHRSNFIKKHGKFDWEKFRFYFLRIGGVFLGIIILLFAWYAKDLPSPGKIKNRQSAAATQIFDRNGKPIYAVYGDVKRIIIDKNEIPQTIRQATLTAEDRNFYRHFGVDLKGIARAFYNNITHKTAYLSGGSTITQQYVKNALLDNRKTPDRKIKELILSLEIEAMYSKEDILAMYLNEIPYGSNVYGIEAAAEKFFNKKASELTLAESATLAALPQAPTYYSPYGIHPDERIARIDWILDSMASLKYISENEAEAAKQEARNLKFEKSNELVNAPHFAMYVKEALIEKYGEKMVEQGGLKVTTTLDLDKQIIAQDAVSGAQSRLNAIGASNASLVSIDPKTGQVLAMVGSVDFFNQDIDGQVNVADMPRQPGSSFKPLVYATAFKEKYNPAFVLWDVETDFGNYVPKNYDGNTIGPVTMRQALAGSLNIPAVKTLALAGVDQAIKTAHDMGITTLKEKPSQYGLSLVLGSGEVKLVDLATAYGVFANGGKLNETVSILKVEDGNGKVLEELEQEDAEEVLDPQVAYEISSILSDNGARAYVFGSNSPLYLGSRPAAAKTGTTSDYKDAWTMGYTPQMVTGVWVGNNRGKQMAAGSAGAMAAAPIWKEYMVKAHADLPVEEFVKPAGIQTVTVDKLSNKLPTEHSPETITDIFASWQAPKDKDDIHIKVRIDKATGKLATADCNPAYTEEKVFTNLHSEFPNKPNWEDPVRTAAEKYGINISYPPTQTACSGPSGDVPYIQITSPSNNASVDQTFSVNVETYSSDQIDYVQYKNGSKVLGTVRSAPYSITVSGLAKGKQTITAVVSAGGKTASDAVTVNVGGDKEPPQAVSDLRLNPQSGIINAYWKNPQDSDLSSVAIYSSEQENSLGKKIGSVSAKPNASASLKIDGLKSGTTYYISLVAIDSSGNSSAPVTESAVTP